MATTEAAPESEEPTPAAPLPPPRRRLNIDLGVLETVVALTLLVAVAALVLAIVAIANPPRLHVEQRSSFAMPVQKWQTLRSGALCKTVVKGSGRATSCTMKVNPGGPMLPLLGGKQSQGSSSSTPQGQSSQGYGIQTTPSTPMQPTTPITPQPTTTTTAP
jgi:hypothetical protein